MGADKIGGRRILGGGLQPNQSEQELAEISRIGKIGDGAGNLVVVDDLPGRAERYRNGGRYFGETEATEIIAVAYRQSDKNAGRPPRSMTQARADASRLITDSATPDRAVAAASRIPNIYFSRPVSPIREMTPAERARFNRRN